MAQKRQRDTTLEQLRAENERLQAENGRLRQLSADAWRRQPPDTGSAWRSFGVVVCAVLAVLVLALGNVLFWTGSTIVQNDRFNAATAPIIRQPSVQHAVASYTTNQLFQNTDVTKPIQDALPSQAAFLAPNIADQLRSGTQKALQKVLARPQFQDKWNKLLDTSHAKFISTVRQSGGNGVIDLNDLYQQLSSSLKNTPFGFLADKQLPPKVGDIQVASGGWIRVLHNVAAHINTWRVVAILLFLLFAGLAIFLARNRRRMVMSLSLWSAVGLLATLVAVRIAREVIAAKVNAQYANAVREVAQVVFHPLVVQTVTLIALLLAVALAAWLTGGGSSARRFQDRLHMLVGGKLHQSLFGEHENVFTQWVGRHKYLLQWLVLVVLVALLLVIRLTPRALLWYVIAAAIAELIIELLAAPAPANQRA